MQFLKPCKIFCQKSENPSIILRNQKSKFFSKVYHLFKKLFWRQTLPFWQPSPEIVCQSPKNSTLKIQNYMKKDIYWSKYQLVKKNAILKMLSKNTTNSIIFFHPRPEITKKIGSFPLKQNALATVVWSRRMALSKPWQSL